MSLTTDSESIRQVFSNHGLIIDDFGGIFTQSTVNLSLWTAATTKHNGSYSIEIQKQHGCATIMFNCPQSNDDDLDDFQLK